MFYVLMFLGEPAVCTKTKIGKGLIFMTFTSQKCILNSNCVKIYFLPIWHSQSVADIY